MDTIIVIVLLLLLVATAFVVYAAMHSHKGHPTGGGSPPANRIILTEISKILQTNGITVTGVLHVGAHECEEMGFYRDMFKQQNPPVVWIEANALIVKKMRLETDYEIYNAVIADTDNKEVQFNIASFSQSSSILPFGLHLVEHPKVKYVGEYMVKTTTLATFFKNIDRDPAMYNYWHLDIQGAELLALKGAGDLLDNVDVILTEVNDRELYKGNPLIGDIDKYLGDRGFDRVLTDMTRHGWGDALYVKTVRR